MRALIKILLYPVIAALSLAVAIGRFLCGCSAGLLSVVSLLLFSLALLSLVLLRNGNSALTIGAAAFLVSPYGILGLLEWLLDRLDDLNFTLKSI